MTDMSNCLPAVVGCDIRNIICITNSESSKFTKQKNVHL
jgi:hypothetical protein